MLPPPPTENAATTPAAPAVSAPAILADKKTTVLGTKRLINAFFYSMQGFGSAWKHEQAFRQEMTLTMVLIPVALGLRFFLPVNFLGQALMVGSVLLVPIVELLNSGLEWCVDLAAQQQRHPFAKRAKDMGSAAVFLSLVNCLVVWILVIAQALADKQH